VLNIDNFIKMCLISYKMRANIPVVIQGEAGVGKTALLRHLAKHVFRYEFIPYTINAGLTEETLREKINHVKQQQSNLTETKVCVFFDEFNTLPELGYFKELMMEHKFMGEEQEFIKKLIVFAACNPYRRGKQ
jgi:MoxR-like ATPase